jgi:L,D-peptidoglycan transpeptidase YkuD (ErfK/YbiS/YcfS/YnhG family)
MSTMLTVFPNNTAHVQGKTFRCALGKNGITRDKKEGDNSTPIGRFPLRCVYYRPDVFVIPPKTGLPLYAITPEDGWCDDVASPDYNTFVKSPHPARHEKLWRDDAVYDLIIVVGYNDAPVIAGKGSAIFIHIARENFAGTEGCVAFTREDLMWIVERLGGGDEIEIVAKTH